MTRDPLYNTFAEVEAPKGLFEAIVMRIEQARQRQARFRLGLFGSLTLLSSIMLVPAIQYASAEFYASGFYEYLSLFVSNNQLVLTYWREFCLSLIEALPSFALLLLIPLGMLFIWSLRGSVRSARIMYGNI